jgi:surfactin synthase thioesterase subunit
MIPDLQTSEEFAMRFLLPALRADLAVLAGRGWQPRPVAAPVHLLCGALDTACPPAGVELLRDALEPVSSRLVAGGHMYVLEQPELAARELLDISAENTGRNLVPAVG